MDYNNLLYEVKDLVGVVTINRPDKLNALNRETLEELYSLFTEIAHSDEVGAVIIKGAGEKAFVAGADIKELNKLDQVSGEEFSLLGQKVFSLIENCGKPVIAAINGYALGGGCELALSCHIRLAAEKAVLGQPEINLGIIPGYGGTQRFTRLAGAGKAMEYILTGKNIPAVEAEHIGLVNKVVPADTLEDEAFSLASSIASKSPSALKFAIKAINSAFDGTDNGYKYEAGLFGLCCGTEDFKEGTSAFLEKRKPRFKGK